MDGKGQTTHTIYPYINIYTKSILHGVYECDESRVPTIGETVKRTFLQTYIKSMSLHEREKLTLSNVFMQNHRNLDTFHPYLSLRMEYMTEEKWRKTKYRR